ncbi:polysaccharide deacetylase family protein [Paenibacillus sp. P96]|uniref:Polysaccharide deacetylase family protein n=1 Tax=Paenibacillus zeirhizosphaerae TaxID=2987519 RepID=A0ABT9FUH5_9BACL|nr:polysaccharide deacetylase family protein [Paenibacillus sp. P96]MDP4098392.1 polysaccharide deacetylase family protein [Paenibacillus sp. P96]
MSNERLVIINADDFGMCHATNQAISRLLEKGVIDSTSIMVTCPWVLEAAAFVKQNPKTDVGIHLTFTSEWEHYKWGPLNSQLSTLIHEFGYFPAATETVVANANPEEIREEAIAQIEFALRMGMDLTHIDNHMGSIYHVTEILLDLCETYRLPLRFSKLSGMFLQHPRHQEMVKLAEEKGVLLLDHFEMLPFSLPAGEKASYANTKETVIRTIKALKPGLTEIVFHPSRDTKELKAITDTWQLRSFEYEVFRDKEVIRLLQKEGIRVVTWREIRDQQRSL